METGEVKKEKVDIKKLVLNEGQIPGVPKNPRLIKDNRYKALLKSVQDDPEMLDLRELLVVPQGDKYVTIGGNMRLLACLELKFKQVPCKILPSDTPVEKLRAYAIKDNVSGGEWDFDLLANDWEPKELIDFGFDEMDLGWVDDIEILEDDYDKSNPDHEYGGNSLPFRFGDLIAFISDDQKCTAIKNIYKKIIDQYKEEQQMFNEIGNKMVDLILANENLFCQ